MDGVRSAVGTQVKERLRDTAQTLDPLQLLEQIRRMQQHLALLADGAKPRAPVCEKDDLSRFLASLSSAWPQGDAEPRTAKDQSGRGAGKREKTRFENVWPTVCSWLESDPDATGKDLFERLQREYPRTFPDGQLRTLQRRLKEWRNRMAHKLAFGVTTSMTGELITV